MEKKIYNYLIENKDKFSKEVLVNALLEAGYEKLEIDKVAEMVFENKKYSVVDNVYESFDRKGENRDEKKPGIIRKIIIYLFQIVVLYFIFGFLIRTILTFNDSIIVVFLKNFLSFAFFLPDYLFKLSDCAKYSSYHDEFFRFILQLIYLALWVKIFKISFFNKNNESNINFVFFNYNIKKKYSIAVFISFLFVAFLACYLFLLDIKINEYGSNVACFKFAKNKIVSCKDSDGNSQFSNGKVRYENKFYNDKCEGDKLVEYICVDDGFGGDSLKEVIYDCEYGCKYNKCNSSPTNLNYNSDVIKYTPKSDCINTDGDNIYFKASVIQDGKVFTDYCINNKKLFEYNCDSTKMSYYGKSYDCPAGCEDGACLKKVDYGCTDSDNGKNYYALGIARNTVNNKVFTTTDACNGDYLNEFFCNDATNGLISAVTIYCVAGCSNGQCKLPYSDGIDNYSCIDSDNGKTYYQSGVVKLIGDVDVEMKDQCSGSRLTEYFCINNDISKTVHTCSVACVNGACKEIE